MHQKKIRQIIIIIVCLTFCRGLIYGLLIPVDQSPDELHHFKLVKVKQLRLQQANDREREVIAARIARTMYYLNRPEIQKQRSLEEFHDATLPSSSSPFNLYYMGCAGVLHVLSLENIRDEIYLIRGISVILGMIVVCLSFLATREIFPNDSFMLVGVPVLITFIPQFSAMNGSINNDKLVEVFISLIVVLMIKIFKNGMTGNCVLGFILVPGLAILSKRTAVFMLPVFLIFLLVYWWKRPIGLWMHGILVSIFFVLLVVGYVLLRNVSVFEQWVNQIISLPAYKIEDILFRPELYSLSLLKFYGKFFTVMYWSFWGVFGYMTIHLHHFWYMLVAGVQCISFWGILWFSVQVKGKRMVLEQWKAKILYLFGASIVFAVLTPFVRSVVLRPDIPTLTQGRYLFLVLIPVSVLTVFGLSVVIPQKYRHFVGVICIIGLIMLDAVVLSKYILLNFHHITFF